MLVLERTFLHMYVGVCVYEYVYVYATVNDDCYVSGKER